MQSVQPEASRAESLEAKVRFLETRMQQLLISFAVPPETARRFMDPALDPALDTLTAPSSLAASATPAASASHYQPDAAQPFRFDLGSDKELCPETMPPASHSIPTTMPIRSEPNAKYTTLVTDLMLNRAIQGKPILPLPTTVTYSTFLQSDFAKSEFLILAMCAIAAKYIEPEGQGDNGQSMIGAGDDQFIPCMRMMGQTVDKFPTYASILGMIYLIAYSMETGRTTLAWTGTALAVRLATIVGLDNEKYNNDRAAWSPTERELRRRLYFTIFELDRYSSMVCRMSMLIQDVDLSKTPLPSAENITEYPGPSTPSKQAQQNTSASDQSAWLSTSQPMDMENATLSVKRQPQSFATSIRGHYVGILMIATKLHQVLLKEEEIYFELVTVEIVEEFTRMRHMIMAELNEYFVKMPFSLTTIDPQVLVAHTEHADAPRLIISIILMFHHVRVALFSSQFFRLFEFGYHDSIRSDPHFAIALESAIIIYDCIKALHRLSERLSLASPAF
eukprot:jgi/Hompol1/1935/HPOL_005790-RA